MGWKKLNKIDSLELDMTALHKAACVMNMCFVGATSLTVICCMLFPKFLEASAKKRVMRLSPFLFAALHDISSILGLFFMSRQTCPIPFEWALHISLFVTLGFMQMFRPFKRHQFISANV